MLTKMTDADWITVLRVFEAGAAIRRGMTRIPISNAPSNSAEAEAQAENPAFRCTSNSKQPLNGI